MGNKIQLLLIVMMPLFAFAQVDRSLLKGKIVADSLEVANISVKNKTANAVTMTDEKGNFRLMAKEKDTLVFSGVSFHSSFLIVSHSHLVDEDLTIRLKVKITALDEIIVRPYTITGNLETDTKKLKVKTIDLNLGAIDLSLPDVEYNPVDNALKNTMGTPGNAFNGVNLI
ncbi:MAG: carboxypeptidase-like regulatory domain-containing protein, partial [Flavobacterium sp.]|nr:carboxypeptidase-like regulatory domain-containing protein [Flavobacterium sp.]